MKPPSPPPAYPLTNCHRSSTLPTVLRLNADGYSIADIAAATSTSYATVRRLLSQHSLPTNRPIRPNSPRESMLLAAVARGLPPASICTLMGIQPALLARVLTRHHRPAPTKPPR